MTKTEKAKAKFEKGDYKGTLKILKTFKRGIDKELFKTFDRGYEAMVHPGFYVQIYGEDKVAEMVENAKKAVWNYFKKAA